MASSILFPPSLLTGDGIVGTGWLAWIAWPMSMGNGGGISIVFSFSCQRSWGRSLGIDSSTASWNLLHPSATVLCPFKIMVWPAATFLTATTKLTQKTITSTSLTFISISIINTCTNIINSSDIVTPKLMVIVQRNIRPSYGERATIMLSMQVH